MGCRDASTRRIIYSAFFSCSATFWPSSFALTFLTFCAALSIPPDWAFLYKVRAVSRLPARWKEDISCRMDARSNTDRHTGFENGRKVESNLQEAALDA